MESLETQLEHEFETLRISQPNRESVKNYLGLLKQKDSATYEHSIRVGLLGAEVGGFLQSVEPKILFFSGTLHDIGKILVDSEVLKKTEGFDNEDMEQMKEHPEDSYNLLKNIHKYSAEIALRHHRFQKNGYPEKLPDLSKPFSAGSELMLDFYAHLLSIIDFYDAATTRPNNKFDAKSRKAKTPEETKQLLIEANPSQTGLINSLYEAGIFGTKKSG